MTQVKRGAVKPRKGSRSVETVVSDDVFERLSAKAGEVGFLKGLLFGPPKTSKTTIACSGSNVLLISTDPEGASTETLRGREDLTVLQPETFEDVKEIVEALQTTQAGQFDWIVLDSLTFLFQMAIGKELNDTYTSGLNIMRPYGKGGAAVSQVIVDLVGLKANVVFTAHLKKESEEDAVTADQSLGEHEVKVAVTPMVWGTLGPAVGFIGRTYRTKEYEKQGGIKVAVDKFKVSFNDGELSPAGSRYSMDAEYNSTPTLLKDLYETLRKESN